MFDNIKSTFKNLFQWKPSYGSNASWYMPGTTFNHLSDAGILWQNSAVAACVNWITKAFNEADIVLEARRRDGTYESINHPVLDLLRSPNPHYTEDHLWSGLLLSYLTAGRAYSYIEYNRGSEPMALYYLPHFNMKTVAEGGAFISYYEYTDDVVKRMDTKEVIHLKYHIDPYNYREGISPLAPVIREIVADNEASNAATALMRNLGAPGISFTPKEQVTMEQKQILKDYIGSRLRGDRRGELMVFPVDGQVNTWGFSPEQMALDKVRNVPEERICSVFGISPIVVGLGAGLNISTYSNYQEAREAAYESCMVPLWNSIADQLSGQLLPIYGINPRKARLRFDCSKIRGLDRSEQEHHDKVREDFTAGLISSEEARQKLGYTDEMDAD